MTDEQTNGWQAESWTVHGLTTSSDATAAAIESADQETLDSIVDLVRSGQTVEAAVTSVI